MAKEIDYDADHQCPVYGKEIDPDLCYDTIMCLGRMFKVSSLSELDSVPDIEEARKICKGCQYSKM